MLILLSFLVSIDSFFISSLTSGRTKSNIILILFSPFLHTIFCFAGIMLHRDTVPSSNNHLILLYLFIILMILSGLYLFAVYNPKKQIHPTEVFSSFISLKSTIIIILLLFCSFDTVVAGIVFAYWNVPIIESLFTIYSTNLILVLLPIFFKLIRHKINEESI